MTFSELELVKDECSSAGGFANMKYIMTATEGSPKMRDHKNEVLHL